MQFLDHTLIWDWCRTHGYVLTEGGPHEAPRLAEDSSLNYRDRLVHSAADDSEAARVLASDVAQILGSWDSCLVWATDWDVWVNEEDWPAYYRWRGEHGERRSLGAAPGHLFARDDMVDFLILITHAIRCGWDVTILPVSADGPTGTRVRCSHDEWIEARSTQPISFVARAL